MSGTVQGVHSHKDSDEPTAAQLLEKGDINGLMRACHDRRLEREGIPMVLGLADEREPLPANSNQDQVAEGNHLADVFDRYVDALVPWAENRDESAVITAMQVLAFTHFAPGGLPITDSHSPNPLGA